MLIVCIVVKANLVRIQSGMTAKFNGDFLVKRCIDDQNFPKDPTSFPEIWAKLWKNSLSRSAKNP